MAAYVPLCGGQENAPRAVPKMEIAMKRQEHELENLSCAISDLVEKLQPVLNVAYEKDRDGSALITGKYEPSSPLVAFLDQRSDSIEHAVQRLQTIYRHLEL